jgi:hypothetical protein
MVDPLLLRPRCDKGTICGQQSRMSGLTPDVGGDCGRDELLQHRQVAEEVARLPPLCRLHQKQQTLRHSTRAPGTVPPDPRHALLQYAFPASRVQSRCHLRIRAHGIIVSLTGCLYRIERPTAAAPGS